MNQSMWHLNIGEGFKKALINSINEHWRHDILVYRGVIN